MAKRVRSVSDLPEWFGLEKYRGAELLDAAGWYEQLQVRKSISLYPESFSDDCLSFCRNNPLIDIAQYGPLFATAMGGALGALKSKEVHYAKGVHLVTLRELYLLKKSITESRRKYADSFFGQFENVTEESWFERKIRIPCTDWIDKPVDLQRTGSCLTMHAAFNLNLEDKALIDQFTNMLRTLRESMRRSGIALPHYRKPDFESWVKFGVLPYIDLRIWSDEVDASIPNRVMADAIFPQGEGGEEVVRKTTERLALDLLDEKHLEQLAAVAAQEIAERKLSDSVPEDI